MKRLVPVVLASLAGLLAPALGSAPASAATTAQPPVLRVLPLGDSITAGYRSSTGNGYRGPLLDRVAQQSRYAVDFVGSLRGGTMADCNHEGHSTYVIDGISSGVDGWIAQARPDVVLLHLGINDLNNGLDTAHAADRAEALVDRIFADKPGVTVIMQGLVPTTPGDPVKAGMRGLIDQYNGALRAWEPGEQQAGKKFRFVDAPELASGEMADGLHPNDLGYARLAQNFYPALDQAVTDGWAVGSPGTPSLCRTRTAAGDFNGDGKVDVVGIDANNNLKLYPGDGAGHVGGGSDMLGSNGLWAGFKAIAAGDFNGDGKPDIVGIDANDSLKLYVGDGAGHVSGGSSMLGGNGLWAGFKAIITGDFNGDNRLDIAGIDANDSLKLYVGDGAGHVSGGSSMLGGNGLWAGFKTITAGDFNGDGRWDVAGIDANNNLKLYVGDGAGHVSGGSDMLGSSGLWTGFHSVMGGDFNGDGKWDVAGIDANSNLNLYPGDGAGHLGAGGQMLPGNSLWAGF
ncbi:hypothetical protein CFP65_2887 [Kitasatospora sp. MMS16-BH015]|uniref:FG-GAP-like repeat-containing protein n=1 Tax=Kitasatospora sp. MMS16-BH015 TaxID=2018025 RepID=UPI000CA0FDFD|nr:FG-GAP-like repeat-containing protein [Kitasatospora sp. MMS16-BH015]AUG77700.1 hypothetical protein CFP65_2887 [Kitasatospora sp. MMS16-BH015]